MRVKMIIPTASFLSHARTVVHHVGNVHGPRQVVTSLSDASIASPVMDFLPHALSSFELSSLESISAPLAANPWSVTGSGSALLNPDFASNLFASSLFPYLVFLWLLAKRETKTPDLANFGFRFLLVFVFATIPAGIMAKVTYNDMLANVDLLHGVAESFLTITNLLIISGLRKVRTSSDTVSGSAPFDAIDALFTALAVGVLAANSGALGIVSHAEPWNALSLPTWIVHTSSLIEWLVAMKLIWEQAEVSANSRWKGLTWAMIPSHTSGLCACTFHFFYNAPSLLWIVSLQGFLTVLGNSTLALAAYRIYDYERTKAQTGASLITHDGSATAAPPEESTATAVTGFTATSSVSSAAPVENTKEFWAGVLVKSCIAAAVVKYGELFLSVPFDESTSGTSAALMILVPTLLNIGKWYQKSQSDDRLVETTAA